MNRFPNSSRVCFVGDSLVNQNVILSWIIEGYRKNFPDEDVRFFNCGTAGGTAEFAAESFEDDVLRFCPTHAVVAFGINDSRRWLLAEEKGSQRYNMLKQSFDIYRESIKRLCNKILENNIELILCTPAPYDEYEPTGQEAFKGGYALMSEYANFIRNFAYENNYVLCDYYSGMVEIMQTDKLYNDDHIHPTAHGYYRMAEIFLREQGIKISEEYDIKSKYPKWWDLTKIYRDIYITECMVLRNPRLPLKEKLKLAYNYLAENQGKTDDNRKAWFVSLCKRYVEDREKIEKLNEDLEKLYQEEILNLV